MSLSLRSLALTPESIPNFLIPSRSSLQVRSIQAPLLCESEHRGVLPPPTPGCHPNTECDEDIDLTTHAAMSLTHVGKVTTPYGFRAVLAASPCTQRRESLFHQKKPGGVKVTDPMTQSDDSWQDQQEPKGSSSPAGPASAPPGGTRVHLHPVKALGLQVMKELKKPTAALKALRAQTTKLQNLKNKET
ncbi:C2 calcium-dependent domain-containing protein 4B-like [Genypterus blacodes]|uniref:C2 calcium-dependent domain-containing protein 4B-like n=1 Tax=Genypterus blacodes TaxID=154954 RepID=UPI003F764265